jgi:vacuolar-type H+-ATPase subunit H
VDRFNENVFVPAAAFTKHNYEIYGAPRVAQLQIYTDEAWKSTLKPRLEIRRQWATDQYDKTLAPHVEQFVKVTDPYITKAKGEVMDVYETTLVPTFERVLPYVQKAYAEGHHVISELVLPYVYSAHRSTLSFLNRRVWPQLVVLYGENVEPQLTKISERLGRYKDSKKLQAAISKEEIAAKVTAASATTSSAANQSSPKPVAEKDVDTREKIQSDLKIWQGKLSMAAEKGSEDLQGRINEITSRQIDNQAHGVGKALLVQLQESAESSTSSLLEKINDAVKSLADDANEAEEDAAYESILSALRSTGSTIRERALAVRTWKQHYDHDTTALVEAALQSTLKVIDNIRDLGLQEIGMRWAWMEGVTYEDWSKYHDLKSTFDEWRGEVEATAHKHKGLSRAQEEGESIQEAAMEAAEKAAKELTRLKDVARWKIDAHDSSPDFSSRVLPPKAKKVAQQVIEAVNSASEAVSSSVAAALPSSQGTLESFSSVAASKASEISENAKSQAESVLSAASTKSEDVSSFIIGTPAPVSELIISEASSSVQSASSAIADQAFTASKMVFGGVMAAKVEAKQIVLDHEFVDDDTVSEKMQSMISAAGDRAADLTNAVSEALQLKPTETQGTMESVTSLAGAQYEKALSAASSALYGTTQGVVESLSSGAAEKYAQAVTAYVPSPDVKRPPDNPQSPSTINPLLIVPTPMATEAEI